MAGDDLAETKKGSSKNPKNSNESKLKQSNALCIICWTFRVWLRVPGEIDSFFEFVDLQNLQLSFSRRTRTLLDLTMWVPIRWFQFKRRIFLCICFISVIQFGTTPSLNSVFQPGKSLYTTVRELVENALDSAESISELPEVEVTMYVPYFLLIRYVSSGRRKCVDV